jgi:hypothetical protein
VVSERVEGGHPCSRPGPFQLMNQTANGQTILANRANCSTVKLTVSDTFIMVVSMARRTLTGQSPRVNGFCWRLRGSFV